MSDTQNTSEIAEKYIHCEILGEGKETVLLINGLARSSRHWLEFVDELTQRGLRVVLVDNRGFGRSKHLKPNFRSKIEDFAEDVKKVLDYCNVEDVHVVGLSLGGMIAMEFAGLQPERVKSLTLVNSSGYETHPLRLTIGGVKKLGKMGLIRSAEKRTQVELAALTTLEESQARYQDVLKQFVDFENKEPIDPKNVAAQLSAATRFKIERIKKNITMPVLVLYSSGDRFVPNKNSFGIQRLLAHSTLKCIEGKGHELMVEAPQAVADHVAEQVRSTQ